MNKNQISLFFLKKKSSNGFTPKEKSASVLREFTEPKNMLVFCFLFFSILGCITSQMQEKPIEIKKLNIEVKNFSELLELNIPLECKVKTNNKTFIIKIKDRMFRSENKGQIVVKENSTLYMYVPEDKRQKFKCEWIKVNEEEKVFEEWLYEFTPVEEDLDLLSGKNFECDVANIKDSEFYPVGKLCMFIDLE